MGDEEGAAQVCVQHEVPVFPGDFQGRFADIAASVVDEDVNFSVVRDRRGHHVLDALVFAHVQSQRQGLAAQRLDLGLERTQCCGVAAGDHKVRASAGEGAPEILAQAAAGAGDEGDFAGEGEGVVHTRGLGL